VSLYLASIVGGDMAACMVTFDRNLTHLASALQLGVAGGSQLCMSGGHQEHSERARDICRLLSSTERDIHHSLRQCCA